MTIEIHKPELEALIIERLRSGAFESIEDILMQALKGSPIPPKKETRTGADLVAAIRDASLGVHAGAVIVHVAAGVTMDASLADLFRGLLRRVGGLLLTGQLVFGSDLDADLHGCFKRAVYGCAKCDHFAKLDRLVK